MRFMALATDYDGTLTSANDVALPTRRALERLRKSGRKALLVTGRRLADVLQVCSCIESFDLVVAENGALLYRPSTKEQTRLGGPPSAELVAALERRSVQPLEVGEVIIATRIPHDAAVLEVIRDLGLERQLVFNRGAVMILPPGINKGTGLKAALRELNLSLHEVVSIGDGENDHSFLEASECAVAVANAVESLKNASAWVTSGEAGAGVVELIDRLCTTDLAELEPKLARHHVALGRKMDGTKARISPYGRNVLIAGPSGSGKSSVAVGFVDRLVQHGYQVCIIDPEGDYVGLPRIVTLGDESRVPSFEEVCGVLRDPGVNVGINLLGVQLAERPAFFKQLMPHLRAMRTQTSRPHWLVIDEAHHLMPEKCEGPTMRLHETVLVTVRPDHLARSVLPTIDVFMAVGESPNQTLRQFTSGLGRSPLPLIDWKPRENRVACWLTRETGGAFPMEIMYGRVQHVRHHRKYALGELGNRSFFFRGPQMLFNLKAHNLAMFCDIAAGLDDATWLFHLVRGDYARWFELVIKDEELEQLAQDLSKRSDIPAVDSRLLVFDAIRSRFSLPE